jgi:hypothetical protein
MVEYYAMSVDCYAKGPYLYIQDIAVSGADVYFAGEYFDSGYKAYYGKNGTTTDLATPGTATTAYGIAVVTQ